MIEYDYSLLRQKAKDKYGVGYVTKLANDLGCSKSMVSQIFNNYTGMSVEMIEKMAKIFKIPVSKYGKYFFSKKEI